MPENSLKINPIREMKVKSALHYHETEMPCHHDVNVYRGCSHGCRYCFARYSHTYLETDDFFGELFVKSNVAEVLDRELSRKSWKKQRINLSGVTDAYQPAEAVRKIMPGVLKVLIRHRNPVVITTKSSLLLRDIELFRQLAGLASVCVNATVTIMDESLRSITEPGASPATERFRILRECREAGCHTNVLMTPVLPHLNDSPENLEEICRLSAENEVQGISAWPLHLRGSTRKHFFAFLKENFPGLLPVYEQLYQGPNVEVAYSEELQRKMGGLKAKYKLKSIHLPEIGRPAETIQLTLF